MSYDQGRAAVELWLAQLPPQADDSNDRGRTTYRTGAHTVKQYSREHSKYSFKRKRASMATPSGSDHSRPRSLSPAKRQRTDDGDTQPTRDYVLRAGTASSIINAPVLSPESMRRSTPSISSATTARTPTTTRSSKTAKTTRSISPTKTIAHLGNLRKPVKYIALDEDAVESGQIPTDIQQLYRQLEDINDGEGFIPAEVRPDFHKIMPNTVRPRWFSDTTTMTREQETQARSARAIIEQGSRTRLPTTLAELCIAELDTLRGIEGAAKDCSERQCSEATWNERVHGPLLRHALAGFTGLRLDVVTTAQIATGAIPPTVGGGGVVAQSKMVDYAVSLWLNDGERPRLRHTDGGMSSTVGGEAADTINDDQASGVMSDDERLASAIYAAVDAQDQDQDHPIPSVNQTCYEPVRFAPIAVSIETKQPTGRDDGKVQLAVWTAAWHYRMRRLLDKGVPAAEMGQGRIVTLPLLLVTGHQWRLYFACDRGHRIEILESLLIGESDRLDRIYKIVASLRVIAGWVQGPYRKWIEGQFL